MLNITYIVGNGYDIGLGLDTSFKSFIQKYKIVAPEDSSAVKNLKHDISHNVDTWADAEMAFAAVQFSNYGTDAKGVVIDCWHDFCRRLNGYLQACEQRFSLPEDEACLCQLRKNFARYIFDFFLADGEYCSPWMMNEKQGDATIRVINLNYTRTFDVLLPSGPVDFVDPDRVFHKLFFEEVCHLHGDLSRRAGQPPAFGVSQPSQVKDNEVRRLAEDFGYLVKPRLDEEFSYCKYATAQKIIEDSDCYVFFGVSFGESDAWLWNAIARSLVDHPRRKAYLSAYFDIHDEHDIPDDWSDRVQDPFWSYVEPFGSMSMMGDLDDQIFPTGVGPFVDPDGQSRFFDPLRLSWLKRVVTKG